MCGIVGVLGRDAGMSIDRQLIGQMNDLARHRGPDDSGLFIGPGIAFGHRRLAIIDLAAGQQPMHDEARRRTVTYNGEIYNYKEIRDRLINRGIEFKTNCDTEVLLKGAEFDSVDWLDQFNGMFAFGIWDADTRTLLLGRDRLGIKPLYYTILDREFIFASEIKPILLHPKVRCEIDAEKIPEYIAFRTISGNGTFFSGIQQVPPGHVLRISQQDFKPVVKQFWREGEGKRIADYVDPKLPVDRQLEELLIQSVRYRLISDVPVGSFNSGGVDSSLNSAIMRSLTDGEMHTFSIGYHELEYDETPFANIVAKQLKTQHHTLVISEQEYIDHLNETLLYLEEPISHPHTVQLLLLSRLAKQYVTVALTGEGADEIFGGYPRLQIPVTAQYLRFVPRILSRAVLDLLSGKSRKLVKLLETAGDVKRSVIENARHVPEEDLALLFPQQSGYAAREQIYERSVTRERTVVGQALYFDQRTYLPSLLVRLDKASMASGLECRVPFLDVNIVEWSRHVGDRYKIRPGTVCKFLVKKVAERWLPREIVYRDKVGFGTPLGRWLKNRKGLGSFLDVLTDQTFRQRGYFDRQNVERLVREHTQNERNHEEALWGLLSLELWCRAFIDGGTRFDAGAVQVGTEYS